MGHIFHTAWTKTTEISIMHQQGNQSLEYTRWKYFGQKFLPSLFCSQHWNIQVNDSILVTDYQKSVLLSIASHWKISFFVTGKTYFHSMSVRTVNYQLIWSKFCEITLLFSGLFIEDCRFFCFVLVNVTVNVWYVIFNCISMWMKYIQNSSIKQDLFISHFP
jgi:hypothetical protein